MRAGRLQQNGSVETFVTVEGSTPNDVSVDEEGGMVYWSSITDGTIRRASVTNGQNVETVLHGLVFPTGIAIHTASQKRYWVEEGRIRRSNLDGTMVEDIMSLPELYRIGFGPDLLVGARGRRGGN